MKIAISGKGGVGKTTIAAALSVLFANEGKKVIAIDADADSNLLSALGVPKKKREKVVPLSQMYDLIEERTGARPGESYGAIFSLTPKVDDLLDKYGIKINGINVMVLGTIKAANSGCFCPENALLKSFLSHLILERNDFLIMDMEAGVEHLGRGTTKNIDLLLIIVEPGMRSIETAEKIKKLADELGIKNIYVLLNKSRSKSEEKIIKKEVEKLKIKFLCSLPYDESIIKADLYDSPIPRDSLFFKKMKNVKEAISKLHF